MIILAGEGAAWVNLTVTIKKEQKSFNYTKVQFESGYRKMII